MGPSDCSVPCQLENTMSTNQTAPPAVKRSLGVFSLVMINVIAIDNLRSLPFSAEFGSSIIGYYILAALCFFIPVGLVVTELSTRLPNKGGIYVWVREAFGERWGFFIIWLQWIYNVAWYPTILTFVAATLASLINPALASNKTYVLCSLVGSFWLATALNFRGMRVSSAVSSIGAIFGTLLPMGIIVGLAGVWLWQGNPSLVHVSWHSMWPSFNTSTLPFLVAVIFGLVGIEISGVHADEVVKPERSYPRAMWISMLVIMVSLILASLAIASIVPKQKLSIITGLTQAFSVFLAHYHLQGLNTALIVAIIIGSLGSVATWIIGPAKGLLVAAQDGNIPAIFARVNKQGVPTPLLMLQAVIFTLLSLVFVLMPSVESAYVILTAIIAQLALVVYIVLFAAAVVLRARHKPRKKAEVYLVPGGKFGLGLCTLVGAGTCLAVIAIGFLRPPQAMGQSALHYAMIVTFSMLTLSLPPVLLSRRKSD